MKEEKTIEEKTEENKMQKAEKSVKVLDVGKVIIEEDDGIDGEDQEKAVLNSSEASEEQKEQLVKALKRVKELGAKVGNNDITIQDKNGVTNNRRKKMETALNYSPSKEKTVENKETTGQRQVKEEKERTD